MLKNVLSAILCTECKQEMVNLGNVNNIVYPTYPPQWQEVHVCHSCRTKKIVTMQRDIKQTRFLDDYREIK